MARIGLAASLLAMFVVSLNCAATQKEFEAQHWDESVNGPIPAYPATYVDSLRVETLPDSGVYYMYRPPDNSEGIPNVENKLRRLYVLGVDITAAWYRPSRGAVTDRQTMRSQRQSTRIPPLASERAQCSITAVQFLRNRAACKPAMPLPGFRVYASTSYVNPASPASPTLSGRT